MAVKNILESRGPSAIATDFLERFFRGTAFDINLRAISIGENGAKNVFTKDMAVITEFVERNGDVELYFGCSTREGGGTKENCREAVSFWADLDFKETSELEARKRVSQFHLPPSIVINSGGGLHLYWFLTQPAAAHDIELILKGLARAIGADKASAEIARVLRVPGTLNHKYQPPREVRIEQAHWERRYRVDQFVQFEIRAGAASSNGSGTSKEIIRDGERNVALTSMAGGMRAQGWAEEEISAALLVANRRRCHPPLPEAEVRHIAGSIGKYATTPDGPTVEPTALVLPDMPETVLCGRLGEILQERMRKFPIAYAWLSLVTVAGTMARRTSGTLRQNLYGGLVGPVDTGKSQAIEYAVNALGLEPPELQNVMPGSAEGLLAKLGDAGGCARLVSPDELGHLLSKAHIENASFPYVLNRAFYNTAFELTAAKGKVVTVNCDLAIIGGCVIEQFDELFDASTVGGLYDRFCFGVYPEPFEFIYRPFEGGAASFPPPVAVSVDPEIWDVKDEWVRKIPGMTGRCAENALRIAGICAAFDGRSVLRPEDLNPAFAFAEYQVRVREVLRPNPGENPDAKIAIAILAAMERTAPHGEWVAKRQLYKALHAERTGPGVFKRAVDHLVLNGELRRTWAGLQKKEVLQLVGHEDKVPPVSHE